MHGGLSNHAELHFELFRELGFPGDADTILSEKIDKKFQTYLNISLRSYQ
jgi:hypothetical protein